MRVLSIDEMGWVTGGQQTPAPSNPPSGPTGDPNTDAWLRDNPGHPMNDPAYRDSVGQINASHDRMWTSIGNGVLSGGSNGASKTGTGAGALLGSLIGLFGAVIGEVVKGPVAEQQDEKSAD